MASPAVQSGEATAVSRAEQRNASPLPPKALSEGGVAGQQQVQLGHRRRNSCTRTACAYSDAATEELRCEACDRCASELRWLELYTGGRFSVENCEAFVAAHRPHD
jgi:hypothetical protein